MKVLLVEDNIADAHLFQHILEEVASHEFNLVHTDRLGDALELLAEDRFDVVLLDLSLPDVQGLDTVRRTHDRMPALPIVVLTGTDDKELAVKAVQGGAQDYLVKGQVDGELMVRAMRYAIERNRAEIERENARLKALESERLVTVGRLAAGIAHELNQPLQTFKFALENLKSMNQRGDLSSQIIARKLAKMHELTDYMASVISDLLGYVRPENEFSSHLLTDIIASVLSIIGKKLDNLGIVVERDFPRDFKIYCNRNAVMRVFANLFTNAGDAYQEGREVKALGSPKRICVRAVTEDHTSRVFVEDCAGGIPVSVRDHVFEPFVSSKPAVKGIGMGLHVVHQIMLRHNGNVRFHVEEGLGTTFELIFPTRSTFPQKGNGNRGRNEKE